MNSLTLLCLLSTAALAICRPAEQYTDKFDSIDLDEILANRRLLVPYVKCMLDQGRCAPEGKELKVHLVDALETNCEKCTDFQREGTRKVLRKLINDEPEYWSQLTAKYDPENKFSTKYESDLKLIKS